MSLNEEWTADVVGRMHRYNIRNTQLARESGYSVTYLSTVLNGHKALSTKGKAETKERIMNALERLESRVLAGEQKDEG